MSPYSFTTFFTATDEDGDRIRVAPIDVAHAHLGVVVLGHDRPGQFHEVHDAHVTRDDAVRIIDALTNAVEAYDRQVPELAVGDIVTNPTSGRRFTVVSVPSRTRGYFSAVRLEDGVYMPALVHTPSHHYTKVS